MAISGAIFGGTLDQNFVLRAEGYGHGRRARTYTVTYTARDSSANSRQASATMQVRASLK